MGQGRRLLLQTKLPGELARRNDTLAPPEQSAHDHYGDHPLVLDEESNFAAPVGIDELAERFGFGVRNFKRRFKDATGYTPLSYLQALRLERAKQLLENTRLGFDAITTRVGYEDSNSFRRLFCQHVGISPATFRKRFLRLPSVQAGPSY